MELHNLSRNHGFQSRTFTPFLVGISSPPVGVLTAFPPVSSQAAESIRASVTGASLQVSDLDLCSYKSVLAFANSVEALVGEGTKHGPLRILVNNAGSFTLTQRWTDDRIDR